MVRYLGVECLQIQWCGEEGQGMCMITCPSFTGEQDM